MTLRTLSFAFFLTAISTSSYANSECELTIEANDMMQFSKQSLAVPATCIDVTLTLNHTGKLPAQSMGHNIVITDTANLQTVATEGMSAGIENDYVKPDDSRVYAHTKVVGGGESTTITFSTANLVAGGDYSFFCSFPGHWAIMKGTFEFK
ncbi:electron transfer flavoprotein [Vibrio furnissii]|uniref:Azurin n=1 Tax=Vibrio furnissii TaxID=29494 RepID=A0A0Q2R3M0_VIBFU|nr:azurin [Vibrio furnissii]KQH86773.1 electron transfer flavoprotein [Vibrio furnissii]